MAKREPAKFDTFENFEEFFQQAEAQPAYWIERAKIEFTEKVFARMKELGVGKSNLADLLGVQPAMVTRLLSGRNNFELATMVKIARVLDCDFCSHLQPPGTKAMWINILKEEPAAVSDWKDEKFRIVNKQKFAGPDECVALAA